MKELEREFSKWVTDTAVRLGWRWWHSPTPMRPIGNKKFVPDPKGRGLPDLFLLHDDPPRLILAELKTETGDLSDEQREFLGLARDVANEIRQRIAVEDRSFLIANPAPLSVHVWRPCDRDFIEAILRGAPA